MFKMKSKSSGKTTLVSKFRWGSASEDKIPKKKISIGMAYSSRLLFNYEFQGTDLNLYFPFFMLTGWSCVT